MALLVLAAVSVTSVTLLLIERQDLDLMQQQVTSLRQENSALKSQLDDHRTGPGTRQESALQSSD